MTARADDAWRDATERFAVIRSMLPSALNLRRQLPEIRLSRVTNPKVTARIRRSAAGRVIIEFGDEFLDRLLNLVEHLDEDMLGSLLVSTAAPDRPGSAQLEAARIALYAMAEQFVMHHELFHLLCGHLDHKATSTRGRRLALDESKPATRRARKNAKVGRLDGVELLPLFVELEADNSALQFLVDKCVVADLAAVFPDAGMDAVRLSTLEGPNRVPAFRLYLAAAWLVLSLFEGLDDKPSKSHPWPAARLLALLFTLVPYYVDFPNVMENDDGEQFTILTDESAADTREYMLDVVRPAMKFATALGDEEEIVRLYKAPDSERSNLFADSLLDLKGLIFDTEVRTPGGLQLLALMRRRNHFAPLFDPFRYIDREEHTAAG